MEKRGRGRPKMDPLRGHQVRYGTLSDGIFALISRFESERDKQLIEDLLESLKPKKQAYSNNVPKYKKRRRI